MVTTRSTNSSVLGRLVLVINRNWVPVHVTTVRRALCMLYQDIAFAVCTDTLLVHEFESWLRLESSEDHVCIRTPMLQVRAPEVVQLRSYGKVPRYEAPFTRRSLYQRDNHTCQYCGATDGLSIDHVIPRSRGGPTTWENCVLACRRCNARKADYTLQEAGLRLSKEPQRPRWSPYLNLDRSQRLSSWRRFTPKGQWDGVGPPGSG